MGLMAGVRGVLHHRMRAYYVAIVGGSLLIVSAFLPWVFLGDAGAGGFPDGAALWILGLGFAAVTLAVLSVITRKNSRHPLLVVGLAALGIMFMAERWMARVISERAWARSQAVAIVDHTKAVDPPRTTLGSGLYVGLAGAAMLVLFGLTIVVRKASRPYSVPEDDDVP
ncbi:MAG: hypothetical protein HY654_01805 [Acidobacteria bacterium]|nr:hypothetical protein [Acidobacteriota bacterium]